MGRDERRAPLKMLAWEVAGETSEAARSEEKWLFSQATCFNVVDCLRLDRT